MVGRWRHSNRQTIMALKFLDLAFTDSVRRAQEHYFGGSQRLPPAPERDALTEDEIQFIESRDSFYLATVTEKGWPYMQHRGGPAGFLRVTGPAQLAFADYKGNRQMLSTGNLAVNDRVCLFLMDYPQRTRLKILGHARVEDARQHPDLVAPCECRSLRLRFDRPIHETGEPAADRQGVAGGRGTFPRLRAARAFNRQRS